MPKTALAGVALESFSARSMASMAAFNVETAPSRPWVGRWDLVAMVEGAQARQEESETSAHLVAHANDPIR